MINTFIACAQFFKIVSSSFFYRSQPVFSQRSWSHLAKNLCGNLTTEKIYRLGCHENRDEDKNHQTATSKSSSPGISGILGTCRNPTPDTSTLHFSFSPLSVSTVQRFELGSHFVLTTWRVCFNGRCHNSLRKSISCCETLIRLSHLHSKLDVRFQPKLGHRRLWSDYETFWEGLQTSS